MRKLYLFDPLGNYLSDHGDWHHLMNTATTDDFIFDPLNDVWLKKQAMKAYPTQYMWVGQDPKNVPAVVKAMALLIPQ